jgi:hypothetical protein
MKLLSQVDSNLQQSDLIDALRA